jgi:hypothetical protein
MAARSRQLQLDLEPHAPETEPYVLTSVMRRHRHRAAVELKLRYTLNFFPELEGRPFGVGLTRQALGLASLDDFAIWLNPSGLTLHTITHELTHLLQAQGLVPGGERSCDVYALARHPSLNDARPNYLNLPDLMFDEKHRVRRGWARVLYESAARALRERAGGRRTYIRWFEDQMKGLATGAAVGGAPAA